MKAQELIRLLLQFGSFLLALLTFIALLVAKLH
ncbi:putative holin-like toxin [Gordoniibacillus kamchatkensis]|nr:putative holin-like toxin [Paenibacillus sp. VKM B-2647]